LLGAALRFRNAPHTFTSRSSQFLEGKQHFWALPAFHFGILTVFFGHVAGLVTPARMHVWTASPLRIQILEVIGLAASFMALIGAFLVIARRVREPLVLATTRFSDGLILALLIAQLCTGVYVAVSHPWGAAWFEALVGPYVRSLAELNPDVSYVAAMPFVVKLHLATAWFIIAVFPFTRLVHMLVAPIPYLSRRMILVRWSGRRTAAQTNTSLVQRKARAAHN
jgi:nitrate reductase gamma subunit